MINFSEIESNLKNLILEKKHIQYIELFYSTFQQASTTEDINNLLVLLFQIEIEHKIYKISNSTHQYKSFLLLIKRIICELLSQGVLPHQEYLHLYTIFSNFDFDEDKNITNLLNYFKEDIQSIPWDNQNKFIENNIILLLEILNGNKQDALIQYTKNILLTNIHIGQQKLHCQFINMFSSSTEDFTINVVLDTIDFYLNENIYFSLSLNEKKSLYAWGYELLINATKFTKNLQTKILYPKLKNLIDIHINNNEIEELMYAEFFTMISQMTIYQKHEESEKFNMEITYPCGEAYKKFSLQNNLIQPQEYNNEKKKIAFLFERLVEHSPFKVVFSLLEQLQQNKDFTDNYEIEIYSLNYYLPLFNVTELEKKLINIGVKVIHPVDTYLELDNYSNRVERALKIRNTIIENKIDIIIACFNSYDILNFLLATRSAPKQIFWSHNNGHYNVPSIDKRISHCLQYNNKFDFKIFLIPINIDKYNPKVDQNIIQNIKDSYPKDSFILGYIGRLIKIDDKEYLETVAKIMKQNPNAIYLACGGGDNSNIKRMIQELDISDRFYFTGHIDAHLYGNIIDLYLSPFCNGGGEALEEYRHKGKKFVHLQTYKYPKRSKKYSNFELYTIDEKRKSLLNENIINENIYASSFSDIPHVINKENYLALALRLIYDNKLSDKIINEDKYYINLRKSNYLKEFQKIIMHLDEK